MRPQESFVGSPVRSLQQMLRVIAEDDNRYVSVVPDGIYGNQTRQAVSEFQRRNLLPVTGVTDQDTWDKIVEAYDPALIRVMAAEPVRILMNPGQVIRKFERGRNVYLLQAILTVLAEEYPNHPAPGFSGVMDADTCDALSAFQRQSSLPETGELDKITWKHLARHFSYLSGKE